MTREIRGFSEDGQVWEHVALGPRWDAAYRLIPQGARTVVAELRVFPAETEQPEHGGRWSERAADVPYGGLPARLVRSGVRLSDPIRHRAEALRSIAERGTGFVALGLMIEGADWAPQWLAAVGERAGLSREERLAVVAGAYAEALEAGVRRTNVEVGRALGLSPEQVRDRVREARGAGLLTRAPRKGVPGGGLTRRGRRVLERVRAREEKERPGAPGRK